MLQVLTGDPREIADELVTHPHAALITFTGGVSIGKAIAAGPATGASCWSWRQRSADRARRCGSRARRSALAVVGSYRNSGSAARRSSGSWSSARSRRRSPSCSSKTRAWKYGDPFDVANEMGTVIDAAAARLFEARRRSRRARRAAVDGQRSARCAVCTDRARQRRSVDDDRA
jgi:hypothetical protein